MPEEVRDELAARAAAKRQSMQEYLLEELERLVSFPSVEMLMREVRQRKEASGTAVTTEEILAARDADRR
ncbi:MAG: hypothetical protein OXC00_06260 [Acidimicrobiaceae bacterium]|nr:hypothetical protein [Acidimicrobiaceae bacterium]